MILRREPNAGLVAAERALEYTVYRALAETPLPVPHARFLELDGAWLDRPFFILDMAPGKPGHPYVPGDPYNGHGERVARQFWHHLGTLAALDHQALGLESLRNGAANTTEADNAQPPATDLGGLPVVAPVPVAAFNKLLRTDNLS